MMLGIITHFSVEQIEDILGFSSQKTYHKAPTADMTVMDSPFMLQFLPRQVLVPVSVLVRFLPHGLSLVHDCVFVALQSHHAFLS